MQHEIGKYSLQLKVDYGIPHQREHAGSPLEVTLTAQIDYDKARAGSMFKVSLGSSTHTISSSNSGEMLWNVNAKVDHFSHGCWNDKMLARSLESG